MTIIKCESDCEYSIEGKCSLKIITLRQERLTDSQVHDNEFFCRNYVVDHWHEYDLIWNDDIKDYEYVTNKE